jgi:hypothetical protein
VDEEGSGCDGEKSDSGYFENPSTHFVLDTSAVGAAVAAGDRDKLPSPVSSVTVLRNSDTCLLQHPTSAIIDEHHMQLDGTVQSNSEIVKRKVQFSNEMDLFEHSDWMQRLREFRRDLKAKLKEEEKQKRKEKERKRKRRIEKQKEGKEYEDRGLVVRDVQEDALLGVELGDNADERETFQQKKNWWSGVVEGIYKVVTCSFADGESNSLSEVDDGNMLATRPPTEDQPKGLTTATAMADECTPLLSSPTVHSSSSSSTTTTSTSALSKVNTDDSETGSDFNESNNDEDDSDYDTDSDSAEEDFYIYYYPSYLESNNSGDWYQQQQQQQQRSHTRSSSSMVNENSQQGNTGNTSTGTTSITSFLSSLFFMSSSSSSGHLPLSSNFNDFNSTSIISPASTIHKSNKIHLNRSSTTATATTSTNSSLFWEMYADDEGGRSSGGGSVFLPSSQSHYDNYNYNNNYHNYTKSFYANGNHGGSSSSGNGGRIKRNQSDVLKETHIPPLPFFQKQKRKQQLQQMKQQQLLQTQW